MKNWTDKAIKQQVEELIEESYLMSLPEHDIKNYLSNFVRTCDSVLDDRVDVHGDIKIIKVKVLLLKVRLLLNENILPVFTLNEPAEKKLTASRDFFIQQVINTKSAILKLLESIHPKLAQSVLDEFKKRNTEKRVQQKRLSFLKINVVTFGYYLWFFVTLALLGVVLYFLIGKT